MENASKALIIAVAVLIAIILISITIYIVSSSSGTLTSSGNALSELEIQTFNSQFTIYEGARKSSSQVLQLLKTVAFSNSLNDNKVAIKLSGTNFVFDSCKYVIKDNETDALIKCNSSKIVSLDEIISNVSKNKTSTYSVTLYYCNAKTQATSNNNDLNPVVGCVLLILISKI